MSGKPDQPASSVTETSDATLSVDDQANSAASGRRALQSIHRFLVRSLVHLVVFLILYVLSIGPMFWIWYEAHYIGGSKWIAAFYEPLRRATQIPLFRDLINDYINWWIL